MSLIENYIATHAMPNVRYDAGEMVRRTDEIQQELTGKEYPHYPQLRCQLTFLFDFISKHFATAAPEEELPAFAEAVFAVKYAVDVVDFVPDFLPGIGRADDSAIVCAVLQRNAAIYEAHAAETGVAWAEIAPKE